MGQYKILNTAKNLFENNCTHLEFFSVPIWFKRFLKIKFDEEITIAGCNYLKNLFPEMKPFTCFTP